MAALCPVGSGEFQVIALLSTERIRRRYLQYLTIITKRITGIAHASIVLKR